MPVKPGTDEPADDRRLRWGAGRALFDDTEAISLLLEAAERCMIRFGTVRFGMATVAAEAGVARSTLYRYFPTRTQLITAFLIRRAEAVMAAVVAALPNPGNAALSLPMLILDPIESLLGTRLGHALFSPDSEGLVAAIETQTEDFLDATHRQIGPLFERWQSDGQLCADLDLRTTTGWLIAQSVLLLSARWQARPAEERRLAVEQYIVRALLRR